MTMPLPSSVLVHMTDEVRVQLTTALDSYGEASLASALLVRGRVSYSRAGLATASGESIAESTVVLLPDIEGFNTDAVLTLPDGKVRAVKSYRRLTWPGGARHLEVVV